MGPDLRKNLHASLESDCVVVNNPKCLDAITKVFEGDSDDLAARAEDNFLSARDVGTAAASVFVALVAVILGLYNELEPTKGVPLDINIPPSVLSQVDSASTASEILFKTADNDASPISVKVSATRTGLGPLKTFTADGNGHAKGDIELDAPNNDVTKAINDFFKRGDCQVQRSIRGKIANKRVDTNVGDCLLDGFTNVLYAMGVNQPLHGLAETATQIVRNFPLPTFENQQYAAAFAQALVNGVDTIPRIISGIAQNRIVLTSTFVFLLSTANVQHKLMEQSKIVLASEQLLNFDQDFKPICPAKGDKYYPQCHSFICEGRNGLCTVSPMRPCPCDGGKSKCPTNEDENVSGEIDRTGASQLHSNTDAFIARLLKMRRKRPEMYIRRI